MGKGKGILFNPETGDLEITVRRNAVTGQVLGGMVIDEVIEQNQAQLLSLHPGELKADPLIGVGISDMALDAGDLLSWRAKVRQSLEADGMKIKTLQFDDPNEMIIDAEYI